MAEYLCQVTKDSKNNELELYNTNEYSLSPSSELGAIRFSDSEELNNYFTTNCISVQKLEETYIKKAITQVENKNKMISLIILLLLIGLGVSMYFQFANGKSSFFNRFFITNIIWKIFFLNK